MKWQQMFTPTNLKRKKNKPSILEEGGIGDDEIGKHVYTTPIPDKGEKKKTRISNFYYHHDYNVYPVFGPQSEGKYPNYGLGILTAINACVWFYWAAILHGENEIETAEKGAKTIAEKEQVKKQKELIFKEHDRMINHFSTNLHNLWEGRYWTLLTASFSHQEGYHLLGNMFAFWLFGYKTYRMLGGAAFAGLYLVGGAASALAHDIQNYYMQKTGPPLTTEEWHQFTKIRKSHQAASPNEPFTPSPEWAKRLEKADSPSLGASGSVMAIAAASAMFFPRDRVISHLRFLPILVPIPLAVTIYFVSGLLSLLQPSSIDHIAHLAGVLVGTLYCFFQWYIRGRAFTKVRGSIPLIKHLKTKLYGSNS